MGCIGEDFCSLYLTVYLHGANQLSCVPSIYFIYLMSSDSKIFSGRAQPLGKGFNSGRSEASHIKRLRFALHYLPISGSLLGCWLTLILISQ